MEPSNLVSALGVLFPVVTGDRSLPLNSQRYFSASLTGSEAEAAMAISAVTEEMVIFPFA